MCTHKEALLQSTSKEKQKQALLLEKWGEGRLADGLVEIPAFPGVGQSCRSLPTLPFFDSMLFLSNRGILVLKVKKAQLERKAHLVILGFPGARDTLD